MPDILFTDDVEEIRNMSVGARVFTRGYIVHRQQEQKWNLYTHAHADINVYGKAGKVIRILKRGVHTNA